MDPVTAIGLATNVAQLVEISWKIVSKSHEIYRHGALPEHRETKAVTTDLQNVNNKLLEFWYRAEKDKTTTDDDESLRRLCESSNQIANVLIKRLRTLEPGDEYRSWKSLRQALKSVWLKSEIDETAARLQAYRTQLNTRILMSLNDKIDRLDGNSKGIMTNLAENRALLNVNQEIHTQYLTKLITAQRDKTRGILADLAKVNRAPRSLVPHPMEAISQPKDYDPRLVVLEAASERNIATLRRALREDPSAIFASTDSGQTALHFAASVGDADLVAYLIRNGARINPDDDEGRIPLHCGVESGSDTVVRALIAKGADVSAKDAQGHTPRDLCSPSTLLEWTVTHGAHIETKDNEGCSALFHFTEQGDVEAVCTLLDQDADKETIGRLNRTPLLEAARQGHVEIAQLLLARGADVHQVDHINETALVIAGWQGHTRVGELLLDHGADIEATTIHGDTALAGCCNNGHVGMGLMLLRRGAQIERHNLAGYAPLHQAAKHGHPSLVEDILDRGGNVNVLNSRIHWTPLAEACEHGYVSVVELLLARGAATGTRTGEDGKTALMRAAERGYIRVIQCLMDHDDAFNIEDSDQEGRTALFWAVIANRIDTVQELLHLGANIEVQDLWRATSLCRACQYAHYEIAELLVHAGANVNAFNSHAWHPLHEVSARGNATMAKLLLDCGADPNCRNDRLYTPLNLAAQGRHPAVVRVLLESDRTEVNAANKDGWTALAEAGHHRQTEITRHLLEHGADANSRDSHDYTPLLRAAQSGHLPAVILLLDQGKATVDVVNTDGWTALAEASWHGHSDMVKALLARGASQDIRNNKRQSPRDLAQIKRHSQVITLLDG